MSIINRMTGNAILEFRERRRQLIAQQESITFEHDPLNLLSESFAVLQRLDDIYRTQEQLAFITQEFQQGKIQKFMRCLNDTQESILNEMASCLTFKNMQIANTLDLKRQRYFLRLFEKIIWLIILFTAQN